MWLVDFIAVTRAYCTEEYIHLDALMWQARSDCCDRTTFCQCRWAKQNSKQSIMHVGLMSHGDTH